MRDNLPFLLSQLVGQAPALLIYLIAFILALSYMQRARTASTLALIGALVSFVTTIGVALVQAYLFDSRGGASGAEFAQTMAYVGIIGSALRAIGLGLLVAAIFADRER